MSDSTPRTRRSAERRTIEEQAAEWFGRCELGLTPKQEHEFMRWLEADARHGEAMREMDDTWEYLDRLKGIRRPAPPIAHPQRSARSRVRWTVLLAAAAAIAVVFFNARQPWRERPLIRQAATEAGGMKKLELPDGSIVHLNASSSVELRFTPEERRVQLLRGEAHFAVARDPARPFIVITGDVAVKAVGTAFNVRREAQAVEVFVTEGKVRLDDTRKGASLLPSPAAPPDAVTPAAEPGLLIAGQRASVALTDSAAPQPAIVDAVAPEAMQQALAWRTRQLDFDLAPLSQIVAEFNRYNSHQLVIADAALARQPFGGSFRADNYQVFVQLLEQRFGVVAERGEERTTLRRAK